MGLFANPRENKRKWASVVMANPQNADSLDEKLLDVMTAEYIAGHARILYESVQLVLNSDNKKTRFSRYNLASEHYNALKKVRKYANKAQQKEVDKALKAFKDMEKVCKKKQKDLALAKEMKKQQAKNRLWYDYVEMETLDILAGDDEE